MKQGQPAAKVTGIGQKDRNSASMSSSGMLSSRGDDSMASRIPRSSQSSNRARRRRENFNSFTFSQPALQRANSLEQPATARFSDHERGSLDSRLAARSQSQNSRALHVSIDIDELLESMTARQHEEDNDDGLVGNDVLTEEESEIEAHGDPHDAQSVASESSDEESLPALLDKFCSPDYNLLDLWHFLEQA